MNEWISQSHVSCFFCLLSTKTRIYENTCASGKTVRGKFSKTETPLCFLFFSRNLNWEIFFSFPFCQIKSRDSTVNTYIAWSEKLCKKKYFSLFPAILRGNFIIFRKLRRFSAMFLFLDEISPIGKCWRFFQWTLHSGKLSWEKLKLKIKDGKSLRSFFDLKKIW